MSSAPSHNFALLPEFALSAAILKVDLTAIGNTTYDLRIDPARKPAEVDLMQIGQKEPYGRGLIRREGDTLHVIYVWGTARPTGFDGQQSGCVLTLVRESAAY